VRLKDIQAHERVSTLTLSLFAQIFFCKLESQQQFNPEKKKVPSVNDET
jgi:hypothetical protein